MAVTGTDFSSSRLAAAQVAFPDVRFMQAEIDHPLHDDLTGRFDTVVASEVVEHLLLPRNLFVALRRR